MPLNVVGGVRAVCGVCSVGGAGRGGGCEGLTFDVSGSAGGGVSVSVNVTICHCNKYPFITCSRVVFECEVPTRVESYFSLRTLTDHKVVTLGVGCSGSVYFSSVFWFVMQ